MYQNQDGDSTVQQTMEQRIIGRLEEQLGLSGFESNPSLPLPGEPGVRIRPDFYSEQHKIIGEIHSHLGKLKPAQQKKVAADILKLHLFDPENEYRKIYAVCDEEEKKQLKGNGWLPAAIRLFKIEVMLIDLTEQERNDLRAAMRRQNMHPEQPGDITE